MIWCDLLCSMIWCDVVCSVMWSEMWCVIRWILGNETFTFCSFLPVCRLLEQEKEEHLALKDTWGMANDRFLETQRVQELKMEKIKKLLTSEQLTILGEEPRDKKETVELLTPPSPGAAKRFLNRKMNKQSASKKENHRAKRINWSTSDQIRSLASLVRGPKSTSLPSTPSSILDVSISWG